MEIKQILDKLIMEQLGMLTLDNTRLRAVLAASNAELTAARAQIATLLKQAGGTAADDNGASVE